MRKVLLVVLLLASVAWAESYNLIENHAKRDFVFKPGDKVDLVGNHNQLNVTGSGGQINVMGNHNQIVDRSSGTDINFTGNYNQVTLDGVSGGVNFVGNYNKVIIIVKKDRPEPEVTFMGRDNKVERQ